MASLKDILEEAKRELAEKEKLRERTQTDMRKATSLSKQAILMIHQKRLGEAKRLLEKARKIITGLNEMAADYPHIIYSGMFDAALQEYSEAKIFQQLVEKSQFVSPQDLNVTSVDYVLGLADVIGECRRFALDALREGNIKKGEECLQLMDEIYIELLAMDESFMLVPGLRRKSDIARRIIETTRGDITQEVRRNALEKQLQRLENRSK